MRSRSISPPFRKDEFTKKVGTSTVGLLSASICFSLLDFFYSDFDKDELSLLKQNGVVIVVSIQKVDYGKFAYIMDANGNKIELWEPVYSILTKMGTKATN